MNEGEKELGSVFYYVTSSYRIVKLSDLKHLNTKRKMIKHKCAFSFVKHGLNKT